MTLANDSPRTLAGPSGGILRGIMCISTTLHTHFPIALPMVVLLCTEGIATAVNDYAPVPNVL